ncbi:thermonuclease family protein [Guggenheimella bovis]
MKRKLLLWLLTFVIIASLFVPYSTAAKKDVEVNPKALYKVVRVIDGDTIVVRIGKSNVTVRLLQVDAPESKHPNKNKNVPMGKTASNFVKKFLNKKSVRLELDEEKYDKYGRLLAYVYVKDKCLNEVLIRESLAKTVKYGKNVKRYQTYLDIERKLRDKKKGIWANIQANYPSNRPTPEEQRIVQKKKDSKILPIVSEPTELFIRGNKRSKIYHMPGQRDYDKISPKNIVNFKTEEEAMKAGYRKAKR